MLEDQPEEEGIFEEVAPPQPVGLHDEAIEPLEARVAHPFGGARDVACLKVDGGADG